jgi:hypothetical protein
VAFVIAALVSFIDERTAIGACSLVIAATAIYQPNLSLLLAVAIVPYTYVFGLSEHGTAIIAGLALVCVAGRVLFDRPDLPRAVLSSPYGIVLAAFAVLLALHIKDVSFDSSLRGIAFMACLVVIFLAVRFCFARNVAWIGVAADAMLWSVVIGSLISMPFAYVPIEWLISQHPRVDNFRLAGVFDGPSAAAHYLIPVFLFVLIKASTLRTIPSIAMLILVAIFVAATMSKGAIAAIAGATILYLTVHGVPRARVGCLLALVGLAMAVWMFVFEPPLQHRAAVIWQRIGPQSNSIDELAGAPGNETVDQVIRQDLRVGTSWQMIMMPDGKAAYIQRPYSIWHTGQRDILFKAAWETIKDHPFWGIGYRQWDDELMRRTGYPFVSPHNGFLELTGAYGVLGGVLYLVLIGVFARSVVRTRAAVRCGTASPHLVWATVSAAGFLIFELVDVATSLAATLPAVWFWILLAIQEAELAKVDGKRSGVEQSVAAAPTGA